MDRVKIKEEAKQMIKGNLWTIWKPLLIVALISGAATGLITGLVGNPDNNSLASLLNFVVSLAMMPISVGLTYYMLKFVRKQNPDVNDLWSQFSRFVPIVVTSFIASLAILGGFILLVIPGIIIAFGLSMYQYILADPEYSNLENVPVLKESFRLMKGYKMDFFVFGLSFLGWMLLVAITFGIAAIYVLPYMTTANALYYENLKKAPIKQ